MDALPAQPPALVEAVRRSGRRLHDGQQADDGSLRRRPPEGEFELDPFVDPCAVEGAETCELALRERTGAGLGRRDRDAVTGRSDARGENAPVERLESRAAPR